MNYYYLSTINSLKQGQQAIASFQAKLDPINNALLMILIIGIIVRIIGVLMKAQSGGISIQQATEQTKKYLMVMILGVTLSGMIDFGTKIYFRSGFTSTMTWETSNLIMGTKILLKALIRVLLFIEIPSLFVHSGLNLMKIITNSDDERTENIKAFRNTIVIGIFIVTITSVAPAILSVFGFDLKL